MVLPSEATVEIGYLWNVALKSTWAVPRQSFIARHFQVRDQTSIEAHVVEGVLATSSAAALVWAAAYPNTKMRVLCSSIGSRPSPLTLTVSFSADAVRR
jgi:hypothetical protein